MYFRCAAEIGKYERVDTISDVFAGLKCLSKVSNRLWLENFFFVAAGNQEKNKKGKAGKAFKYSRKWVFRDHGIYVLDGYQFSKAVSWLQM